MTDHTPEDARPILLDFYCCQGGASAGYRAAGFYPFGVDIDPQPHYPYAFHQGDALRVLGRLNAGHGIVFTFPSGAMIQLYAEDIAAYHGSPPCQAFTLAQRIRGNGHPDLIAPTRELFKATGRPWIIENVEGAPLRDPMMLCGPMFGLETYRHRLFESNSKLTAPAHPEHVTRTTKMGRAPKPGEFMHVVGNFSGVDRAREIMGMPWATRDGLREAIPPAYTTFLGEQIIEQLGAVAA